MGFARVIATLVVLTLFTLIVTPIQWLAIRRRWALAALLPWYWQRLACFMAGVRIQIEGTAAKPPLLIAANHISWLDISVLGSIMPVSFVAKREVAGWPVVGMLARLQRSVFIDRTRRTQAGEDAAAIASRVGQGDVIVLFAEGTTGDGNRILPFRSALLGATHTVAGEKPIMVQPVAITYSAILGLPVGHAERASIAWYGDMKLGRHFFRLVGYGAVDVLVTFGKPIPFGPDTDRKVVTAACFAEVRRIIDDVRKRQPGDRGRPPVFSGRAKGATSTPDSQPESREEEVTSRIA